MTKKSQVATAVFTKEVPLNWRDLIEVAIVEKEIELEDRVIAVTKEMDDLREVGSKFEENFNREILALAEKRFPKKMFIDGSKNKEYAWSSNTREVFLRKEGCINAVHLNIYSIFPAEYARQKVLVDEHQNKVELVHHARANAQQELINMPKLAKRLKAMAVKKALKNTEEGAEIIEYFNNLRNSIEVKQIVS